MAYTGFFGRNSDTVFLCNFQGDTSGTALVNGAHPYGTGIAAFDTHGGSAAGQLPIYGYSGVTGIYAEDKSVSFSTGASWVDASNVTPGAVNDALFSRGNFMRVYCVYYAYDNAGWTDYAAIWSVASNGVANSLTGASGAVMQLRNASNYGIVVQAFMGADVYAQRRLGVTCAQNSTYWNNWIYSVAEFPVTSSSYGSYINYFPVFKYYVGRVGTDASISATTLTGTNGTWSGFKKSNLSLRLGSGPNANGSYAKVDIAGFKIDVSNNPKTYNKLDAEYKSFLAGKGVDLPPVGIALGRSENNVANVRAGGQFVISGF